MYIPYDLLKEWSYRILLSLSTSLVLPASDTELLPVLARRLLSCEGCIRSLTLTGGSVCLGEETPRVSAISLSWISRDTPTRGQDPVKKNAIWILYNTIVALRWNPQGRRKRGRPRNSWWRSMEGEMREAGFNWQQLERHSQDREGWRDFLKDLCPPPGERVWVKEVSHS